MEKSNLTPDTAVMLVRRHLAALRHYPGENSAGERQLARTLEECTLGVSHAERTLSEFGHLCPTPEEIRTQALTHRAQFAKPERVLEACPSCHEPAMPGWLPGERDAVRTCQRCNFTERATYEQDWYKALQAELFRERRHNADAEIWTRMKQTFALELEGYKVFGRIDPGRIPAGLLKCWKRELGIPLNGRETNLANEWEAAHPRKRSPEAA